MNNKIKNTNKGFTIVEIVIVMAVIAILASVLIPTFSNMIKKANMSNDISICRNMNNYLSINSVEEKFENFTQAKASLNSTFKKCYLPKVQQYHYYWYEDNNTVYYVEDAGTDLFNIQFPEDKDNIIKSRHTTNPKKFYRLDLDYDNNTDTDINTDINTNIDTDDDTPQDNVIINAPTLNIKYDNTIELNIVEDNNFKQIKYGINTTNNSNGITWQDSNVFGDLNSGINYYCFVEGIKEDDSVIISDSTRIMTRLSEPVIIVNDKKVSVTQMVSPDPTKTIEYAIFKFDTDESLIDSITWTDNIEDEELSESGNYRLHARYVGDNDNESLSMPKDFNIACCFAKGTKITMGDLSLKNIEDIKVGDVVLTYNHEKGCYENQKVCITYEGEYKVKPFTLYFNDGTKVSITNTHYLFEKESLKYVPISKENVLSLIGNHYYSCNTNDYIELVNVVFEDTPVEYYTLYTEYNYNYFAAGMLNISDDISAYLNFYTFKEDLSVDMDALSKDIKQYGLCEYSTDMPMTEEEFNMWNGKYANIIIGKGLLTWDDVQEISDDYNENYK